MMNTISAESLSPVAYNQSPVITTELLAQIYGTTAHSITKNHRSNADRFILGKHYYKVVGEELATLRITFGDLQISPKTRSLILWTERGAARHAKMLETDQAWEVFEKLEDCYFGQHKNRELPAVGLGPLNIDVLLAIRDDKVAFINQYSPGALMTADEALALLKARGWLVMPREELAGRLMEL
ncbi:ORF6N domain-containing protein [Salmonella enterica]|uniref:ORF6N domain-containing protein n=1 Tax=Salmonella enterica TaxID=28901 RepID=A0A5V0YQ60_SALER|nr:ORF6N domain-containing protein [Salmonella enterica]EBR8649079.1 ORF6N domain-containing protein [Salmonella enterica subsp. enterica serovar Muenchen]ECS7054521.1 ORF6N domain-containing protein [Salmonella enterica subsp. enterica serovar Oranienburg]EDA2592176.1 ORF6N domain-containing protein [Salmonella enterica subsp. enterica serovar Urbana]EDH4956498.1 ORF6N domain-containing protein [Salmonella enterica subsp. enterica serovar Poona]EEA7257807.1 ORF6N domain-containing protein [Sa